MSGLHTQELDRVAEVVEQLAQALSGLVVKQVQARSDPVAQVEMPAALERLMAPPHPEQQRRRLAGGLASSRLGPLQRGQ